jgi:ribosomal protein RSM22 (predicted rRNA methylase)
VKSGSLGYEDEKFSYVIGSRGDPAHAAGRIVRHPQIRSGHVRLRVCRDEQLVDVVVSKRQAGGYRWARDARWGDEVPADELP